MPTQTFEVTAPNGQRLEITGDRMPTEAELRDIFAKVVAPPAPASTSNLDRMLSLLPTAGGAIGGIVGGIGGTAFGMGVGGVPGAVGGAAVGGAGGEAARQLINQWRGTGAVPATPLEAAKDIGTEGAVQAAYELGGSAVTSALSKGGRAIYRGYLKPSLSEGLRAKAAEIVETGIRENVPVTDAGAAKVDKLIGDLRGEVDRILASTKGEVSLTEVANKVRAFARRMYYKPGKPIADYEAAMKVADELDSHPSIANPFAPKSPATANLSNANEIKRGVGESIGDKNFGIDRGATKAAQKETYHELRTGIEDGVIKGGGKDIGPLNARESKLIDLEEALSRATGRESNRNQVFGAPSLVSAGAAMSEVAHGASRYGSAAVALATRIGLSPMVASQAAILAARLGDAMPGTAVADIARAAVAAVQASSEPKQQP